VEKQDKEEDMLSRVSVSRSFVSAVVRYTWALPHASIRTSAGGGCEFRNSEMNKVLFALVALVSSMPAFGALPTTNSPELQLVRTIRTNPFSGTAVSAQDPEGSDFIDADEFWLAADKGSLRAFRITTNGTLVQSISRTTFSNAPRFGGGPIAGSDRTDDFESAALAGDLLHIFSGTCCSTTTIPAVFRMNPSGGDIVYQDLPTGSDFPASATRSGVIYVGTGKAIRTYDFSTNALGLAMNISGLSGSILGMDFTPSGEDLLIVTSDQRLFRVNPVNKMVVSGWNLDLTPFGIRDSRSVMVVPNPVGGYDQLYVSDGLETRPVGDPLRYAVFIFDVLP
ncbi:MAG: hypothetical protein ACRD98_03260, partial [Nitrososphaera sp.]